MTDILDDTKLLADWFSKQKPAGYKWYVNGNTEEPENLVNFNEINVTLHQKEVDLIIIALQKI